MKFLSLLGMDLDSENSCFPEMTWPVTAMIIKMFSHAKFELDVQKDCLRTLVSGYRKQMKAVGKLNPTNFQ